MQSPDSKSDPVEPIKRITTSSPNDTRSPFYDPLGFDMKPMAKLHLSRQRLYEKTCEDSSPAPVNSGGETDNKDDTHHKRNKNSKYLLFFFFFDFFHFVDPHC